MDILLQDIVFTCAWKAKCRRFSHSVPSWRLQALNHAGKQHFWRCDLIQITEEEHHWVIAETRAAKQMHVMLLASLVEPISRFILMASIDVPAPRGPETLKRLQPHVDQCKV